MSLDTIAYVRSIGAYAIRGNHDQYVIGWRAWFEKHHHKHFDTSSDDDFDYSTWSLLDDEVAPADWTPPPVDWRFHSQHYRLARQLSGDAYKWLCSLPLTLHIRPLHAYVVHAGLLPWSVPRSGRIQAEDSGLSSSSHREPTTNETLASLDPDQFTPESDQTTEAILNSDEKSVLMVQQNRDPYTLIEMRGVRKHGRPTKDGKDGKPWTGIWNRAMKKCKKAEQDGDGDTSLPARKRQLLPPPADLDLVDNGDELGLAATGSASSSGPPAVDSEGDDSDAEPSDSEDEDEGDNEDEIDSTNKRVCRKLNVM